MKKRINLKIKNDDLMRKSEVEKIKINVSKQDLENIKKAQEIVKDFKAIDLIKLHIMSDISFLDKKDKEIVVKNEKLKITVWEYGVFISGFIFTSKMQFIETENFQI